MVAVWLGVLALPVGLDAINRVRARELRGKEQSVLAELQTTRAEVRTVAAEATRLRGQVDRATALRAKRAWSNMFLMLGTCMSDHVWLTYVGTDPVTPTGEQSAMPDRSAAAPTGEKDAPVVMIEAPRKLVLRGYAADHPELYAFMTQLKRTDVFTKVMLMRSAAEPVLDGQAVAFELVCEW